MKILLLGDASNYHKSLSVGLARAGHDVTVASNGSRWMETDRDIDISRSKGKFGGALLWLKLNTLLAGRLKGYDVVQIHNPIFLDLRPNRVRSVFDRLRRDNGGVFLTALGTDSQYVEMCFADDCPLRYSEFRVGERRTGYANMHADVISQWRTAQLSDHSKYIYDNIDGVVSALYEYHLSCRRHLPDDMLAYGGIPVDVSKISFRRLADNHNLSIVVACHKGRESEKGIDILMPVLHDFAAKHTGQVNLDFVQNVPFAEFQRRLDRADIVVDQLYSYTPATTALMTMASGRITISGAEPEFYDFIGEDQLRPIINADPVDPESLSAQMEHLLMSPGLLGSLSDQGRAFVEKHNDVSVVADRFIKFWERRTR